MFFAPWLAAVLAIPLAAQAGDFGLKLEPGVAVPMTEPQSEIYRVGGGQTVKALFGLNRYLDIGPSLSFTGLPAASSMTESGSAWTFGGGLRLKRPHDAALETGGFHAISPWIDVDAFYARTGELNRPGLSAGVGLAVPIGKTRSVWFGPFVRYLQILQPERSGFDNRDARILSVGLSLEVGSGIRRESAPVAVAQVRTDPLDVLSCPDRDKDTIPDNIDHCPDAIGRMDNWGCPPYDKLVIKRDKLELKEKLYFAWNEAVLEEASLPVLDEVVRALQDNKGFRVQVDGHSSSEGADDHNQTLSERRAEAVVNYLVTHGVSKERLVSKGFSSSVPIDTNTTPAGRQNNRRVEFVVYFIILDDGSAK